MINLLPPQVKAGYRYGRLNVGLRKWVIIFLVALAGLGGLGTYGLLSMRQSTERYEKQVAATETTFQKENFEGTQKEIKDISNSFKLVVKVLGQEVLFSQLLKQIAGAIPDNANLTGLTIAQTKGAIDISAVATDYNTATQVQVNLADPENKIFSKADIISVTCDEDSSSNPRYPCKVDIRALFGDNNPFLFVNSEGNKP